MMKTLWLCVILLCPSLVYGQVFFNTEKNSGTLMEITPGISYYQDRTKRGMINEAQPGMYYFSLQGKDGKPGQSGFATDITPRYTPIPDTMPPLPKSTTIYDLPSERLLMGDR